MRPSLSSVLEYQNPAVVNRFMSIYTLPKPFVEELFNELKMFIWLSEKRRAEEQASIHILQDQCLMDEMWHNFILFTREYREYCLEHYGHICDHNPCADPNIFCSADMLKSTMIFVEKHLGSDTLKRWYIDWPEKYTKSYLYEHMKISDSVAIAFKTHDTHQANA